MKLLTGRLAGIVPCRFGLALQELASKLADAPADQLTLLQQVSCQAVPARPVGPGTYHCSA